MTHLGKNFRRICETFSKNAQVSGFRSDERGSVMIFSMFMLLMILIVTGLSVDLMRTETRRTQLQSTLDRAVLSGASLQQTLDSEAIVRDYFERADLTQYLQDVTVTQGTLAKTVSATAKSDVESFFINMIGFNTLPAPAAGTASEGITDIEISLVLDVSGSMKYVSAATGNTKLEDVKDAAQEFIYRVMCNPDAANLYVDPCTVDPYTVSINLIVYNSAVSVGENLLQRFNVTNEHTYSSCVNIPHAEYFNTGISLSDPLQRAADSHSWFTWNPGSGLYWTEGYANDLGESNDCYKGQQYEIMPLESDWVKLFNRIEILTANGGTSIEKGIKWGVALLDPSFRPATAQLVAAKALDPNYEQGIDSQFLNRPADFTNDKIDKFVVLMTDGVNTESIRMKDGYYSGPSGWWVSRDDTDGDGFWDTEILSAYNHVKDVYQDPFTGTEYTTPQGANPVELDYAEFWHRYKTKFYTNDSNVVTAPDWFQSPINPTNPAQKNANLVAGCEAATNQSVEIFTVGFETTTASEATLKKCASSHAHHFSADGANIDHVFAAIGRKIQKLRLVN